MAAQRANAKKESKFEALLPAAIDLDEETKFVGYEDSSIESEIKLIFKNGKEVKSASGECMIVLDTTPFYGESGGQVGDKGKLSAKGLEIEVLDTQKVGNFHLHISKIKKGSLNLHDRVKAEIDTERRRAIVCPIIRQHILCTLLCEIF